MLRVQLGELPLLDRLRQGRLQHLLQRGYPGRRGGGEHPGGAQHLEALHGARNVPGERLRDDALGGGLLPDGLDGAGIGLEQAVRAGREARPEQRVVELGLQARGRQRPGGGLGRVRRRGIVRRGDLAELVGERGEGHGARVPAGLVGQVGDVAPAVTLLQRAERARVGRAEVRGQRLVFAGQARGPGGQHHVQHDGRRGRVADRGGGQELAPGQDLGLQVRLGLVVPEQVLQGDGQAGEAELAAAAGLGGGQHLVAAGLGGAGHRGAADVLVDELDSQAGHSGQRGTGHGSGHRVDADRRPKPAAPRAPPAAPPAAPRVVRPAAPRVVRPAAPRVVRPAAPRVARREAPPAAPEVRPARLSPVRRQYPGAGPAAGSGHSPPQRLAR